MSLDTRTFINGVLLEEGTGNRLAGITVTAWRQGLQSGRPLGSAVSGAEGRFRVPLPASGTQSRGAVRLVFTYGLEELTPAEGSPRTLSPVDLEREVAICLPSPHLCTSPDDLDPVDPGNDWSVYGLARHEDGTPLAGLAVRVVARTVSGSTTLGSTTAGNDGFFQVNYPAPGQGQRPPHVAVEVLDGATPPAVLYRSDTAFSVAQLARVDVTATGEAHRGASEFATVQAAVDIERGAVAFGDIDDDALEFIIEAVGLPAAAVRAYVRAGQVDEALATPGWHEQLHGVLRRSRKLTTARLLRLRATVVASLLDAAATQNTISRAAADQATAFTEALVATRVARALDSDHEDSLIPLALAAGLSTSERQLVSRRWAERESTVSAFWSDLEAEMGAPAVQKVRRAITLHTHAEQHLPMVEVVAAAVGQGALSTMATYTRAEWGALIDAPWSGGATVGVPSGIDGSTPELRRENYITALRDNAERAFPSARVRVDVAADQGSPAELRAFLDANPSFDFAANKVEGTGPDAEAARKYQRLFSVSPGTGRWSAMGALGASHDSALSIARTPRSSFVADWSGALGGDEFATDTHMIATGRAIVAQLAYVAGHPDRHVPIRALGGPVDPSFLEDDTEVYEAAGNCDCDPCLSLTGPAAYLVDLLAWIDSLEAATTGVVGDDSKSIHGRRPDLRLVELSCDNTYRQLPYIDLVNEILEREVLVRSGETVTIPYVRSTLDATELLVTPEHVVAANSGTTAYDIVGSSTRSLGLPYHLWNEQARTFLAQLGVSRVELLRAMSFPGATEVLPGDASVEALGLSAAEVALIVDDAVTGQVRWGYDATVGWVAELEVLATFMARARLTYAEVLELLHCRAANPGIDSGGTTYIHLVATDPCDADAIVLRYDAATPVALVDAQWRRLSRFLRLSRALGVGLLDCDRVLAAMGVADADDDTQLTGAVAASIGALKRLSLATGRPVVQLLGWFVPLDTRADRADATRPNPPRYDRLFLDAATFPEAADPVGNGWAFRLNPARTELADAGSEFLAAHAASIAAALGTSTSEAEAAVAWVVAGGGTALNLANVSDTVRRLELAAVLGTTVSELKALDACSAIDPFASPRDALNFVEEVRSGCDASFTAAHLLYVTTHDEAAAARVGLSDTRIQEDLGAIRDRVRARASDFDVSGDADTLTQAELEAWINSEFGLSGWRDDFIVIAGTSWLPATPEDKQDKWEALQLLCSVHDDLAAALDMRDFRARLIGAGAYEPAITGAGARFAWAQRMLRWGAYRAARIDALREEASAQLAARLGRNNGFVERLRSEPVVVLEEGIDGGDGGFDLVDLLLSRNFLALESAGAEGSYADLARDDDLSAPPAAIDDAVDFFTWISKVSTLFAGLGLDEDEQAWWADLDWGLVGSTTPFGLVDLRTLRPYAHVSGNAARYVGVVNARVLFAQRQRLPGADPGFAEILDTAASIDTDVTSFAEAIATRTGWAATDVSDACTALGYATPGSSTFQDPAEFRRLVNVLDAARRLGVPSQVVIDWFTHARPAGVFAYDASQDDADAALRAARSRYPDVDSWAVVARPLRDRLRTRQRDALVAWLLADPDSPFADESDLFGRLLIDTQMAPIALTSRIRQASLSAQTYLQRNMMGIDRAELVLADEERDQWAWRKSYRVWEAARKVFLYPENYLDATLRTGKTEVFERAEAVIEQGELDSDLVGEAVLAYTRGLVEVASLLPATFLRDEDGVVHVVGRSEGEVRGYYYRRLEDGSWTPWEKIEAGISGVHLALAVDGGRVYLLWLKWGRTADTEGTEVPDELGRWRTVQVQWAERSPGGDWSAAQSSEVYTMEYVKDSEADTGIVGLANEVAVKLARYEEKSGKAYKNIIRSAEADMFRLYTSVDDHRVNVRVTCSAWQDYPVALCRIEPATGRGRWSEPEITDEHDESDLNPEAQGDQLKSTDDRFSECPPDDVAALYLWDSSIGRSAFSQFPDALLLAGGNKDLGGATVLVPRLHGVEWPDNFLDFFLAHEGRVFWVHTDAASLPTLHEHNIGYDPASFDDLLANPYQAELFFHPYAGDFLERCAYDGALGLLFPTDDATGSNNTLARQQWGKDDWFNELYAPVGDLVGSDAADKCIEFRPGGAFTLYNWELFFHLPMLAATRLAGEGRFEDALTWIHCVYDPRSQNQHYAAVKRPWRFKPFLDEEAGPSVEDWAAFVGTEGSEQGAAYQAQLDAWLADPFDPHRLAMLRPGTYQRWVMTTYLDILLGWGDQLFAQDSMESINEATQLYLLAGDLLGDRPVELSGKKRTDVYSYDNLPGGDPFDCPAVAVENQIRVEHDFGILDAVKDPPLVFVTSGVGDTYFCVPRNEQLYAYWDTVADRLFKIRNSLDLSGKYRALSLYAAPIDPDLLVRAAALGVDIASAIASATATLPSYRFTVLLARSRALAEATRALGGALLSALEKKEAEELALLRNSHERALLDLVTSVREQQVAEATSAVDAVKRQVISVEARRDYYERLIKKGLLQGEKKQIDLQETVQGLEVTMALLHAGAVVLGAIPAVGVGSVVYTEFSGEQGVQVQGSLASAVASSVSALSTGAQLAGLGAGWRRRSAEWKHQQSQAELELESLAVQTLGAEIRLDIARRELENHRKQVANAAEIDDWMRAKYTSGELYNWMVQKLSGLHMSAYDLALTTARKAEACYRHEIGASDSAFVGYAHWDSLRSGLLAGESLAHDLDRMEAAYLDNDARELELSRQVSLARLDPAALEHFRATGECWVSLPEALFDLDCPGHYFRRLQSVSLTVPCVAGAAMPVHVAMSLSGSRVRRTASTTADLVDDTTPLSTVVSSTGADDQGLFNPDPRDSRYLPFERRGAVSDWHLRAANQDMPGFDWSTVTDLVLGVRYTARDGGESFRNTVVGGLPDRLAALYGGARSSTELADGPGTTSRVVIARSLARDFADEWYRVQEGGAAPISIDLGKDHLPYFATGRTISTARVHLLARVASGSFSAGGSASLAVERAVAPSLPASVTTGSFAAWPAAGAVGLATGGPSWSLSGGGTGEVPYWPGTLAITLSGLDPADLDDLVVLLEIEVS